MTTEAMRAARAQRVAEQREDYVWLRSQGESVEEAARRVGVKPATGRAWERDTSPPRTE